MSSSLQNRILLWLSPLAAPDPASEQTFLPRKFVDGIADLAELWDGRLVLAIPDAPQRDDTLDYIPVERAALPFDLCAFPTDATAQRTLLQSAALVCVPMVSRYIQIPSLCAALHLPFVLDADFTPTIREEIIRLETKNPLRRWRRLLWQHNMEKNYTAMVRAAQGIQLHGPEAFNTYAPLNPSPMMYLNTRVHAAMLPTPTQMQLRVERLRAGKPLRLIYSGRWRAMKGVQDLPRVALELRRFGVRAEWDIFGGGALAKQLERAVADAGLDNLHLNGERMYPDLMRFAADTADLFVCCHKQGDPSTTFIEMLSMGVPLVGYDTSGLRGMVSLSGAGWLTPRGDVNALAARLAELDRDRESLIAASCAAVEFTRDKTFQDESRVRVAHLNAVAANYSATL